MDRMLLGVVVVLGHPVILLSCLIGVVLFLSWIPVSGLSNAKVSDGSQPPGASATPLGVAPGARSLGRLVRLPSAVSGEAPDAQVCQ
jgi:hypothetical protein